MSALDTDGFVFAAALAEDIPEIVALYQCLVGTPGCTWDDEYPCKGTAEADVEAGALFVLKREGIIAAVASAGAFDELGNLPWKPQKPCELARIGVLPSMQGRGVGSRILVRVIETMKGKGFDGIRMLVSKGNASALAMYEKNGFERCGETFMFDIDFYCYQMVF